jgi:hypothetical protein
MNITELQKQRQELLDKVAELEKQIEENGKYPEHGQEVCLASLSALDHFLCFIWEGNNNDKRLYNAGLVKPTSEEATEVSKKMFYQNWFASLSDVTPKMWENSLISKHFVYYAHRAKKIETYTSETCEYQCTYFSTKEKLKEAIATIGGEEILKKYVLGVTE